MFLKPKTVKAFNQQPEETDMYLVAWGNRTALGTRAGMTAASVRAGFSFIKRHPDFEDDGWQPIYFGESLDVKSDLDLADQFRELGSPAIDEVVSFVYALEDPPPSLPVIVGLPEPRPGLPEDLESLLVERLIDPFMYPRIEFTFDFVPTGHTSGIAGLQKARDILKTYPFCIVGGIDSYIDEKTIRWLEHDVKRLHCSTNKNGFIPGQAAGFCLFASHLATDRYDLEPRARVLSIAFDEERNDYKSGLPSTGDAIRACVQSVIRPFEEGQGVDAIYTALNGEPYATYELAHCMICLGNNLKDPSNVVSSFSYWGDIGAASVPVNIGLAAEAAKKNYAKGPITLFPASSMGKRRAAALMEFFIDTDYQSPFDRRMSWQKNQASAQTENPS